MINKIIGFVAVIALLVGGLALYESSKAPAQPVGAASGNDFFNQINTHAGQVNSTLLATTSQGSVTVTANEFGGWLNSSIVSYIPIATAAATITLPASSTLKGVLQNAGDKQSFCFRSATTTAGIYTTIAGGTGTNLLVASSSISALGGVVVMSGKVACFTAIRQPVSATAFDIDVLMTVYK